MGARRQLRLLEAGSRAPGFQLARLDGGEAALGDLLRDGPVLLAFFKVTCPVCQMAFPYLERLSAAGYRVFGISQNDPADTREFNREFGVTFPTLLDSEDNNFPASNAYGLSSVPTLFLIDREGNVQRVIEGWNRRDMEWLAERAGTPLFTADDRVPLMKPG